MLKSAVKRIGERYPEIANPLWKLIYPRIRGDEYFPGYDYGDDRTEVFTEIFKNNNWHSEESRSGVGSTLVQTRNIRKFLPKLVKRLQIESFLDCPCGDFNWMQHVEFPSSLMYTGGDIVPALIDELNQKYASPNRKFQLFDIVADEIPAADILLCRDVLFHLPISEIQTFLDKLDPERVTWLLTTTYPWMTSNRDVKNGGFRCINLEIAPFFLNPPVEVIDDFNFPERPRALGLWRVSDIVNARKKARD